MYMELETDDCGLILGILKERVENGKAVRVTLSKVDQLHRLTVSEISAEPIICGNARDC